MPYQNAVPKFEDVEIGEQQEPRTGVYLPVYERMMALRLQFERENKDNPEIVPRRGVRVSFTTRIAGSAAIKRMNEWANEDGYYVVFTAPVDGGRRDLYLEKMEEPWL